MLAALMSVVVAALVFTGFFFLSRFLLDHTVYGQSFAKDMVASQSEDLQEFIEEETVTLENIQILDEWCDSWYKVYLRVYYKDNLVFNSQNQKNFPFKVENDPGKEDPENEYILTLSDDTTIRAFLYYYAGDILYLWMTIASGFLAFLAFSLCLILLVRKKVFYIRKLREELEILSGGQLEYPITVNGDDELAELAVGIDQMRRSILRHQEMEGQMRSANTELITAMSHDLRTPLTSLLAYLEILERKKYTDEEQMQNLLHKSVGQTMRIRDMADKLFQYFLVYATEWESAETEELDADMLFLQILDDYAGSLESKGIQVERSFSEVLAKINVNPDLLQRALDNLYSNLLKYADPERPVKLSYRRNENKLHLTIENGIVADRQKKDSTQIGLNTCRRIIEFHGGTFFALEQKQTFAVTFELPLIETAE